MKVVFLGTPDFAVPSLEALIREHQVAAVFCQPDRPKGRSKKPQPCPVKQAALAHDIPVYQPKRIRFRKWTRLLAELEPDLIVVAAFGQLLSQKILDLPKIDCVNVHASLLPRWRGASPIHQAILHGDDQTGVAIMKMELALDAGPVYSSSSVPIPEDLGRMELEKQLAQVGADLLLETIPKLTEITPQPQQEDLVTHAPIIQKTFGYCDPTTLTAVQIRRMLNAYEEWPGVYLSYRDTPVKLLRAEPVGHEHDLGGGEILEVTRKQLIMACADGTALRIHELQPSGKKPQPVAAFINGYRPTPADVFTTR